MPESRGTLMVRVHSPEAGYLNVRSQPTTSSAIVTTVAHTSKITPLEAEGTVRAKVGQYGQWLHVRLAHDREGYVAAWYLALEETVPEAGAGEEGGLGVWVNSPEVGYLNIRRAGSIGGELITQVHHGARVVPLEVEAAVRAKIGRYGEWLQIRIANGREGYGFAPYFALVDPMATDGSLEPPAGVQITVTPSLSGTERRVALAWNRLGGLLQTLADQMGISPGVVVAVLTVESGGRSFGPDGRMMIRFENHVFYDRWGQHHGDVFARHFTFNPDYRWKDQRWRPTPDQAWWGFHGDQGDEWQVFEFARTLDDTAARLCIAMGGAQIMGFNYDAAGYGSVREMFDGFGASEREQVVGFFKFVRNRSQDAVRMLQSQDFEGFAAFYNGSGQATTYGSLIRGAYEAYRNLRAVSFGVGQAAPGAPPEPTIEVDDLERILGIGPKAAATLAAEGIHSFAQLAALEVDHVRGLLGDDGSRARLLETWPAQARLATWGDWKALEAFQAQLGS